MTKMRLCDYILRHDDKLDLADVATAKEWLQSRPWWHRQRDDEEPLAPCGISDADLELWQRNILVLRSTAKRLKGRRNRRAAPKDLMSVCKFDMIFEDYIRRLRPLLDRGQKPLSATTFRGIQLHPTEQDRHGVRHVVHCQKAENYFYGGGPELLDVFWQIIFYSLIIEQGFPGFCVECGRTLPATKKGKPSRATICSKCKWRRWEKKQPRERMREKWKIDAKNRNQ